MRVLAVLFFCVAAAAASPLTRQENRIIGGSVTTINNYPHIAALLYSTNLVAYSQSCGSAVINQRSLLTAAHCFHDESNNTQRWRIRVGSSFASSGGTVYNVDQIIFNPNYNRATIDADIAILRSVGTIVYVNNAIQPANIAGSNYNLADNQAVWAVGWGITENGWASEQLRHVQTWTVNQVTCRSRYSSVGNTVTDNMLCSGWLDVGGRDQCQGDSGGPLYHNGNVVVGVCSWGRGCAEAYFPGVNARVSRFASWIQSNA